MKEKLKKNSENLKKMNYASNKAITLTSLIIYITVMFVVLAAITRIILHFRSNMVEVADVTFETEFEKFNLYFLDETKKTGNSIEEISEEEIKITFSTGNKYSYKNNTIYLNNDIKICEQVKNCTFVKSILDNGKTQITVTLEIGKTKKEVNYVMNNIEQSSNIDEFSYVWDEYRRNLPVYSKILLNENGVLTVNVKYTDGEDVAVIPKGFKVSDEEKEQTISEGLVIQDEAGNEFVWVPVGNINSMIMCQVHGATVQLNEDTLQCPTCKENTKLAGKIYAEGINQQVNFELTSQTYTLNKGIREPDILNESNSAGDGIEKNLNLIINLLGIEKLENETNDEVLAKWKNQIQTEFENMAKSVQKNSGFYIGRYETYFENNTSAQSQKGKYIKNANNWYEMYFYQKCYATDEMGVVSEMIWGSQYDQVMKFVNGKKDGVNNKFDVTSYGERNSETTVNTKTGENSKDVVANIYDLEGGRREWTQEANVAFGRVSRGSSYAGTSSASERFSLVPGTFDGSYSSRITLYIK